MNVENIGDLEVIFRHMQRWGIEYLRIGNVEISARGTAPVDSPIESPKPKAPEKEKYSDEDILYNPYVGMDHD